VSIYYINTHTYTHIFSSQCSNSGRARKTKEGWDSTKLRVPEKCFGVP